MRVKAAFTHTFGPSAGGFSVDVPAGSPCDFHRENDCWYVRPSALPIWAQHDATYRGVPVALDNLEA